MGIPLRSLVSARNNGSECDESAPVMTVRDLASGYNGQPAIRDLTFDVYAGERIGIVGPNGAGKSTLFKALVGLLPHQGAISILGASCRDSHGMIGYVPQHEAIDWRFPATVWDVVMMGRARQIGYILPPRKRDRVAVREALERVGMWALRKRQIGELSGGQRRRVFVARALAQRARVLLLDEPFSGVDVRAQADLMNVLDRLNGDGLTILLSTHDLDLAFHRFDRVLALRQRLIALGTPQEVYQTDILAQLYGKRLVAWHEGETVSVFVDEHGCADC